LASSAITVAVVATVTPSCSIRRSEMSCPSEDDYDAEFRYDRDPVGALQGLAPDHVIYAGSASKSLAPGLRIGWLCCPPGLAGQVTEAKRAEDLGAPILDQLALADLMNSGRFDRHLRRCRARYRSRRDALAAALGQHARHVKLAGISAGLHAVAVLPDGADEKAITGQARRRSVGLYPVSTYRISQQTSHRHSSSDTAAAASTPSASA
jgi:GntR family transcriptional regulator / MocR family aminotransferase